jgi:O-antigen ligase
MEEVDRNRTLPVVIEGLTLFLIAFPVLHFGGRNALAQGLSGVAGAVLLGLVLLQRWRHGPARPVTRRKLPYPEPWLVLAAWGGFALVHVVQLAPLPSFLVRLLAGWPATGGWAHLSPDPDATVRALISWLPAFAVFAAVTLIYDTRAQVRRLVGGLLLLAALVAVYGIFETIGGRDSIWGVPKRAYLGCVTGTFINRNHFAAFMTLGVGAALGLGLYRRAKLTGNVRQPGGVERLIILSLGGVLCLLGILLSRSRGGLASVALAGFPIGLWLVGSQRRRTFVVLVAALVVTTLALGWWVSRQPLTERFADLRQEAQAPDSRPAAWATTLRLIARAPLLGAGAGSFEDRFRLVPDTGILVRYNHAHCDPLETLAETGLIGFLGLFGGIFGVIYASLRALAVRRSRFARLLTVGVFAGVAAVLFHSLFDFPLQIPGVRLPLFAMFGVVYLVSHRRLTR